MPPAQIGIVVPVFDEEVALEEAFAERQESEDTLRRFLADASRELRTPLASIRGYAGRRRACHGAGPEDRARGGARCPSASPPRPMWWPTRIGGDGA